MIIYMVFDIVIEIRTKKFDFVRMMLLRAQCWMNSL